MVSWVVKNSHDKLQKFRSSRAEKNSSLIEKKENESSRIASSSYGKVKKRMLSLVEHGTTEELNPENLVKEHLTLPRSFSNSIKGSISLFSLLKNRFLPDDDVGTDASTPPSTHMWAAFFENASRYMRWNVVSILRFFFKFRINLAFDIDFVTLTSSWIARFNVDIRQCMWKNSKLSNENSIDIEKSLILKLYHVWEASKFLLYWIFTSLSSFHLMSMPNLTQWHLVLTPTLAAMSSSSLKLYRDTEEFSWFLFNLKIEIKNSNKYSSLSLHGLSWVSFTSLFALSPRFQHILCVKRVENLCHFKKEFFIYSIEKYYCCATACTEINLVFSCSLFWRIEAVNYTPRGLKPFIDELWIFSIFWVF